LCRSTEQTYRSAANENLLGTQAHFLSGEYFLAHYLAVLAVECHLRAYLRRKTNDFEPRHDLVELAKRSQYYNIVSYTEWSRFSTIINTMNLRWRSNHRYYSESQLLDYLNNVKAEYNVKGDRWKNMSRTMADSAYIVIRQGEAKWNYA
jgi:HEPN domain-containing protein